MDFKETCLRNSYLILPQKIQDSRGYFSRTFDKNEFVKRKLNHNFVQDSISFNEKKGTIRGMHFQKPPFQETKIVSCIQGKIFDVIIDLRIRSKTYKKWFCCELDSKKNNMIYIPEGFAHGFQTLDNNVVVSYKMSEFFNPKFYYGIRWNDPIFNINWPLEPTVLSEKDKLFPNFSSE